MKQISNFKKDRNNNPWQYCSLYEIIHKPVNTTIATAHGGLDIVIAFKIVDIRMINIIISIFITIFCF
jgi:hypothetical protein